MSDERKCKYCTQYRVQHMGPQEVYRWCEKDKTSFPEPCIEFSREPGSDDDIGKA